MNSEILRTIDALANSTLLSFDTMLNAPLPIGTEDLYKQALRKAESRFGEMHGEVGLLLIGLASLYRQHSRWEELIAVELRIEQIQSLYQEDSES